MRPAAAVRLASSRPRSALRERHLAQNGADSGPRAVAPSLAVNPRRTWGERLLLSVLDIALELLFALAVGGAGALVLALLEKLGVTSGGEFYIEALVLAAGVVVVVASLFKRARDRHRTATGLEQAHGDPALPIGLPLQPKPAGDAARSIRSAALFTLALVFCFAPAGSVVAFKLVSPLLGIAVFAASAGVSTYLLWRAREPVPLLRFTGDRLRVGARELRLDVDYACSFSDRGRIGALLAEASGAPPVVVSTTEGEVRFRPGRYEPVELARLVQALVRRAADGDARRWLLETWPLPAPETVPEGQGPWISPVVGAGIAIVFGLGMAMLVVAAAIVRG